MNKHDLITKIKQLDGLTQDERATLIDLVNTKKKYGLVWEDKPEDVEEQLRTQLPVLREVVEKRIKSKPGFKGLNDGQDLGKGKPLQTSLFDEAEEQANPENPKNPENQGSDKVAAPNHILIEGDNLHALTALTFTHEGRIDVIYIDPPYNTGNKDFKYNDSFVDREDSYRHSKWLSFMDKRLRIAKRLLSEKGVIFISIDDNEQAPLRLLCDEVFGEESFVENIIWKNKYGAGAKTVGFISVHEYVYCFSKRPLKNLDVTLSIEEQNKYNKRDEKYEFRGGYITQPLMTKSLGDRPNLMYPITYNGEMIIPDKQWVWAKERLENAIKNNEVVFSNERGKWSVRSKQYLKDENGKMRRGKPISILNGPFTQEGTDDLRNIFGKEPFGFPKPMDLIKYFLSFQYNDLRNDTSIILDFFAGSGTTLHATMQLNAEDGGNRQCILVTNNENNICEEVTYERNKRVIQGYTNSKGQWVPGLTNNNLRYYRSEFVGREPSLKNKRQLTQLATELLCIKEDCYEEQAVEGLKSIRYFSESEKHFVVVYNDTAIESAVEFIKDQVASQNIQENGIKVYVFSPGQYPFTEEFEEVLPYIKLCALPDAIYKAYMNVLPNKKPGERIPELTDEQDSQETLVDE